jgi:hypothetical protein
MAARRSRHHNGDLACICTDDFLANRQQNREAIRCDWDLSSDGRNRPFRLLQSCESHSHARSPHRSGRQRVTLTTAISGLRKRTSLIENPYESPTVPPRPRRRYADEREIDRMLRTWVLGGTLLNLLLAVFIVWKYPDLLPFRFVGIFAVIEGVIVLTMHFVRFRLLQAPLAIPEEEESDWLPH